MERKNIPAAWVGVQAIGEPRFAAGGFVAEWQRIVPRRQTGRNAGGVFGGYLRTRYFLMNNKYTKDGNKEHAISHVMRFPTSSPDFRICSICASG